MDRSLHTDCRVPSHQPYPRHPTKRNRMRLSRKDYQSAAYCVSHPGNLASPVPYESAMLAVTQCNRLPLHALHAVCRMYCDKDSSFKGQYVLFNPSRLTVCFDRMSTSYVIIVPALIIQSFGGGCAAANTGKINRILVSDWLTI